LTRSSRPNIPSTPFPFVECIIDEIIISTATPYSYIKPLSYLRSFG
jgi:hypothetical protein